MLRKKSQTKKKEQLPTIEHRRFIRHPLCLPISFKVLQSDKDEEECSKTINVSLGGLLFSSKRLADVRSRIMLKMPLENKVFYVRARVVRCVKQEQKKMYDIAVTFSRPQEAFKVKMIEQIYLISEYRDLLTLQSGKQISLEEASRKWIKRFSLRFSRLYW